MNPKKIPSFFPSRGIGRGPKIWSWPGADETSCWPNDTSCWPRLTTAVADRGGRAQHLVNVFQKRLRSDFEMAMGGATDLIKPLSPSFYSFTPFWAKLRKSQNISKSYEYSSFFLGWGIGRGPTRLWWWKLRFHRPGDIRILRTCCWSTFCLVWRLPCLTN